MTANLDLAAARTFLATLDPTPGARYGFACFADHGDDFRLAIRLYGDLDQAVRLTGRKKGQFCSTVGMLTFLQSRSGGVFVTVQSLDGNGATARNVDRIRAVIADADDDVQLESLHRFIARSGLEPSIMVASGGPTASGADKLQAYWRIDDCPVAAFAAMQAMLLSRTGTDPAVKDVARVLRLPGFLHQKRTPRMTSIISITDRRYSRSDFECRARAQPQIAPMPSAQNTSNRGTRRSKQHQADTDNRTGRLRALLDRFGGLITPAVHALLREAQAPGEGTAGNRHATLVAVAAKLAQTRWDDESIRQVVLPVVNATWSDGDWGAHLDRITTWVRAREVQALAAVHTTTWPSRPAQVFAAPVPPEAGAPA